MRTRRDRMIVLMAGFLCGLFMTTTAGKVDAAKRERPRRRGEEPTHRSCAPGCGVGESLSLKVFHHLGLQRQHLGYAMRAENGGKPNAIEVGSQNRSRAAQHLRAAIDELGTVAQTLLAPDASHKDHAVVELAQAVTAVVDGLRRQDPHAPGLALGAVGVLGGLLDRAGKARKEGWDAQPLATLLEGMVAQRGASQAPAKAPNKPKKKKEPLAGGKQR